jgi:DNA invertase Pin-like site-specific DNA recombinase
MVGDSRSAAPRAAAVAYHRVSTIDQRPELAREELRRAARARDLELVAEIEETGSGARNDRPGLARLMDLVHQHRIAWVLIWKLDRFGRSVIDVLTNVRKLKQHGVTLVCTSQGLEVGPRGNAISDVIVTVLAAAAELERNVISERTRLGLVGARARGKILGRPKGSTDRRPRRKRGASRVAVVGS